MSNTTERWAASLTAIEALITEDFGERCPDRSATCACCVAWRAFDDLADLADIAGLPRGTPTPPLNDAQQGT